MQLISIVSLLFQIYYAVVLVRVVMSWVRLPSSHPVMLAIGPIVYGLTEPLLRPLRNLLRPYQGGMPVDFSPLLLMLAIGVIQGLVLRALGGV